MLRKFRHVRQVRCALQSQIEAVWGFSSHVSYISFSQVIDLLWPVWGWMGRVQILEKIVTILSFPHILSPLGTFLFFQVKSGKNWTVRAALKGRGIHTCGPSPSPAGCLSQFLPMTPFFWKAVHSCQHQAVLRIPNPQTVTPCLSAENIKTTATPCIFSPWLIKSPYN